MLGEPQIPDPAPQALAPPPSRLGLFLTTALGMIVLDQITKWWARAAAEGVENRTLANPWPGVFELKLVYNEGIAFGMLQGFGILLWPIAIGIALAAGLYSFRHPRESPVSHVAMGLLAAGAIGNLIDRVLAGKVTDMFYVRAINFPVFNVADVCITFAAILLSFHWLKEATTYSRRSRGPQNETSIESNE